MKVWITKYALTKGIMEFDLDKDAISTRSPDMIEYAPYHYARGNDWHREYNSAVMRAREMQTNKIASLKKQLERIQRLRFA